MGKALNTGPGELHRTATYRFTLGCKALNAVRTRCAGLWDGRSAQVTNPARCAGNGVGNVQDLQYILHICAK
jgi:hypothetical protein